jgi:putative transcriptional regulator
MRDDPANPPLEDLEAHGATPVFRPQWIRRPLEMPQQEFAKAFGLPPRSLQQWQQARSTPGKTIQSYFRVIALEPDAAPKALQMRPAEYHAQARKY